MAVVLIDQDGVLADFDLAFFQLCKSLNGGVSPFTFGDDLAKQTNRFMDGDLLPGHEELQAEARRQVADVGWFAGLPPVASDLDRIMAQLADRHEVWICTKPMANNPYCVDEKRFWVEHHIGEGWADRVITASDKSLVMGDYLLDDAIKPYWTPEFGGRAVWEPVVFPAPYNFPGSEFGQGWRRFDWGQPLDRLAGPGE